MTLAAICRERTIIIRIEFRSVSRELIAQMRRRLTEWRRPNLIAVQGKFDWIISIELHFYSRRSWQFHLNVSKRSWSADDFLRTRKMTDQEKWKPLTVDQLLLFLLTSVTGQQFETVSFFFSSFLSIGVRAHTQLSLGAFSMRYWLAICVHTCETEEEEEKTDKIQIRIMAIENMSGII